jgi:hypothetical protein
VKITVVNPTENTIVRAGMVFRPGPTDVVVPDDYKLRSIRACRSLNVIVVKDARVPVTAAPSDRTPQDPPRNICACGFVAKSKAGLRSHQRRCEACL